MKHEARNRSVEVELSAGELSSLVRPVDDEMSRAALTGYMAPMPSEESAGRTPARTKTVATRSSAPRTQRFSGARAFGILGSVVIAGIAVAAHYELSESKRAVEPPSIPWTPLPERPEVIEAEEPTVEAPPTLYVNPFDKTEVFELPPGLTKDEARDMVAQILVERARERSARSR